MASQADYDADLVCFEARSLFPDGVEVGMQMEGLPIDYVSHRNEKIEAVTLADVNRVAGTLMTPDKLTFVVVGKPEGVTTRP